MKISYAVPLLVGLLVGGMQLFLIPNSYAAAVLLVIFSTASVYVTIRYYDFLKTEPIDDMTAWPGSARTVAVRWRTFFTVLPVCSVSLFVTSIFEDRGRSLAPLSFMFLLFFVAIGSYVVGIAEASLIKEKGTRGETDRGG